LYKVRRSHIILVSRFLVFFLASSAVTQAQWPQAKPEAEGVDGRALDSLMQGLIADTHKDIKGVVIVRHDKLVAETCGSLNQH
jgi:hypothetical protein